MGWTIPGGADAIATNPDHLRSPHRRGLAAVRARLQRVSHGTPRSTPHPCRPPRRTSGSFRWALASP
ncbi:MAG: hypothetical protein GY820_22435, partial [Gammaproteobacteria bacterium]|nr:hypothetical protein [Gammaproteobacteria bacterium]